jgi:hypothetical protein
MAKRPWRWPGTPACARNFAPRSAGIAEGRQVFDSRVYAARVARAFEGVAAEMKWII